MTALDLSLSAMEEYDDIYEYLENKMYPEGLSKNGKRNWRRKCQENFKIENGQLFHRKSDLRSPLKEQQEQIEPAWRLCIRTKEEKERILKASHSSATGIQHVCITTIVATGDIIQGMHVDRRKARAGICDSAVKS